MAIEKLFPKVVDYGAPEIVDMSGEPYVRDTYFGEDSDIGEHHEEESHQLGLFEINNNNYIYIY